MPHLTAHRDAVALLLTGVCLCGSAGALDAKDSSTAASVPAGTVLYLRLQTPVSTKTSKEGQAVVATVERAITIQGGVAIPPGATVRGKIEKCSQPDRPDQRADLLLSFQKIEIPGEGSMDLKGRISGVPNARESLLPDGTIVGVLETDTPAALLSGALAKLGAKSPDLQKQIEKQKIGQVNTAIEYAQGTDLQFTLGEALPVRQLLASDGPRAISGIVLASIEGLLATAPQRSVNREQKPGDPINLVMAGSAEDIAGAFRASGWSEPKGR